MEENTTIIHSTLDDGYDFFITDKWNKKYHFKIASFPIHSGLFTEAYEVIDDHPDNEPRVFQIISDFDDEEKAELLIKAKIKKGINKRYLKHENGHYEIGPDLEVAGRIIWDDNLPNSSFNHFFQIDGKKITVENFIDLLECVEGWNFKFRVIDTTDEVD